MRSLNPAFEAHFGKLLSRSILGEGIERLKTDRGEYVMKSHIYADREAKMLRALAPHLCVPEIIYEDESCFVIPFIKGTRPKEEDVARDLASLHQVSTSKGFGFDFDTTIGPYEQCNRYMEAWPDFYTTYRLLPMMERCYDAHEVHHAYIKRLERLLKLLPKLLPKAPEASLIHGDIWSGNVLSHHGKPCYIDPACYYAHSEMELGFIQMFSTYGERFYEVYHEIRPIDSGFWKERQYLYMLYWVLVHIRSFGASYLGELEGILRRFHL